MLRVLPCVLRVVEPQVRLPRIVGGDRRERFTQLGVVGYCGITAEAQGPVLVLCAQRLSGFAHLGCGFHQGRPGAGLVAIP